jgi:hypothetical protein
VGSVLKIGGIAGMNNFNFTFTEKEVSIIEAAIEEYLEGLRESHMFAHYDVAELSAKITERLAW